MFDELTTGHELQHGWQTTNGTASAGTLLTSGLATISGESLPMMRVLVIEDSEVQIRLIRGMLANSGEALFELSTAVDLASGLNLLADSVFDAILLDLTLPDSFGIESCQQVNSAAPSIPIVVLTGVDDEDLAVATLQHGAQDYLIKGEIGNHLLARSIRYAVERKKSELALQTAYDLMELQVEQRTAELRQLQEEASLRQDELAHASRLNTLGEMASGLAHELNQPLMAIIGFTDYSLHMLRSDRQNPNLIAESLEDAAREAKRAGEIIKRMRRLVRRRPAQHVLTCLNDTVTESVQLLRPGLDVAVSLQLDASLPQIGIDRIQIQQVILNLAGNAVQAMDNASSDERRLTLRTGCDAASSMLFVEVSDTGPGLPQEDLERLFNPFFSRRPGGLGLGLSISRTIVESHGGRLTVSENARHGLTFRFTLSASPSSGVATSK
ncbi:MAG: ATP-binding protein [Planctomycetota bacterium]|nr:ATP-binding protein [Planctomycetota bacterium]